MNLSSFDNSNFDRGASRLKEMFWAICSRIWFRGGVFPAYRWRRFLLRLFGAKIGRGVVVKPGARIAMPWRLTVGDHVWIGEEAYILNLAPVTIGSNVCISQRTFLCTGSHDWSDPAFALRTAPITVEDGVWVSANVFVAGGVTLHGGAVVTAGSVVTSDMPEGMICSGNPCVPVKGRRGSANLSHAPQAL